MENRDLVRTVQHVDPLPDENEEESQFEEEEYDDEEAEEEEEYDYDDEDDDEEEEVDDDDEEEEEATEATEEISGSAAKQGEGSKLGEGWNLEEMEGLVCPICFEAWSNGGEHYPSCLPCGHLYGMSCIRKWFALRRSCNKCPQCKAKCSMKDVRRIYGSRVIVHDDDELQRRVQSLEAKCNSLKKKDANWRRKEAAWLRREAYLHMHLNKKKTKTEGGLSGAQGSQEQLSGLCPGEAEREMPPSRAAGSSRSAGPSGSSGPSRSAPRIQNVENVQHDEEDPVDWRHQMQSNMSDLSDMMGRVELNQQSLMDWTVQFDQRNDARWAEQMAWQERQMAFYEQQNAFFRSQEAYWSQHAQEWTQNRSHYPPPPPDME